LVGFIPGLGVAQQLRLHLDDLDFVLTGAGLQAAQVLAAGCKALLSRDERRDLQLRPQPVARLDLLVPADSLVVALAPLGSLAEAEVNARGVAVPELERA